MKAGIFTIMLMALFANCSRYAETMKPEQFFNRTESWDDFISQNEQKVKHYRERKGDEKKLVICNFPFEVNENSYDMVVLFKGQVVYMKSSNSLKLTDLFTNDELINFSVGLVLDKKIHWQSSKAVFGFNPGHRYYYLSFYPDKLQDETSVLIVPSDSRIE